MPKDQDEELEKTNEEADPDSDKDEVARAEEESEEDELEEKEDDKSDQDDLDSDESEEEIEGEKENEPQQEAKPEEPISQRFREPEDEFAQFGPIKRPDEPMDEPISENRYSFSQPLNRPLHRKSNKKTIILLIVLILVLVGGFLMLRNTGIGKKLLPSATPTPAPTPAPVPTELPKTLNKEDWSFEVLNGSGKTGFAKQIADQIKQLGYQVVKVGNAQNQDFEKTQIFVKDSQKDDLELVIADLKDVIKVASYGGELKEGTASARIIIGKDSI